MAPALWLVGGEDPTVPPEIIRELHALTPGSEYIEVAGSGHSVYFEDAAAFNQHVGAFLEKHIREERVASEGTATRT